MSAPYLVAWETEDQAYEFLARLNTDGHHPELASIDANGTSFLATLTDPDADRVHHVVTNESGRAHCCGCDYCESPPAQWNPCTWRPTYPVTALCKFDPAHVRGLIDREGAWG